MFEKFKKWKHRRKYKKYTDQQYELYNQLNELGFKFNESTKMVISESNGFVIMAGGHGQRIAFYNIMVKSLSKDYWNERRELLRIIAEDKEEDTYTFIRGDEDVYRQKNGWKEEQIDLIDRVMADFYEEVKIRFKEEEKANMLKATYTQPIRDKLNKTKPASQALDMIKKG